jgi:hypothetical protein
MASISGKLSNKVFIMIFQILLAGRRTHKIRFFMGSRGILWVRLWEVKILWVQIMGVTLVRGDEKHNDRGSENKAVV